MFVLTLPALLSYFDVKCRLNVYHIQEKRGFQETVKSHFCSVPNMQCFILMYTKVTLFQIDM